MAKSETLLTIQSFHQCASLISIKLNSSNYLLWKSQVLPLIRTLGLEHHLTEDSPTTNTAKDKEGETVSSIQLSTWTNNDGLLTSWLLGIIAEDVLALLEGTDTAKQVWNSLEELLLTMTKENEIHLNEALLTLKKGSLSLDEYIRKFKSLCDRLAAMKKPLDDVTKVFHLARGLGTKYKDFRIAMLSKAPYPTYNQFVLALKAHDQLVIAEEEEEKTSTINLNQAFYTTRGRSRGRGRQFTSRGRGFYHSKQLRDQTRSVTPQRTSKQTSNRGAEFNQERKITCQICGKNNHTALECWNRFDHAYQSEELPEALAALTLHEVDDANVYADSGATSHVVNDPESTGTNPS